MISSEKSTTDNGHVLHRSDGYHDEHSGYGHHGGGGGCSLKLPSLCELLGLAAVLAAGAAAIAAVITVLMGGRRKRSFPDGDISRHPGSYIILKGKLGV